MPRDSQLHSVAGTEVVQRDDGRGRERWACAGSRLPG